jgi:hypothetical protein
MSFAHVGKAKACGFRGLDVVAIMYSLRGNPCIGLRFVRRCS